MNRNLNVRMFKPPVMAAAALIASGSASAADLEVMLGRKGPEISSTMYGLFFEDINFGADGGMYGELVKNRSFEFPQTFMGWDVFGDVTVRDDGPFDKNPHYVRLAGAGHKERHTGLQNEGFFGIGLKKGENYRFSVWARAVDCDSTVLRVLLVDPATMRDDQKVAEKRLVVKSKDWRKYTLELSPSETVRKGMLRIFLAKPDDGAVDLEHISLFPEDTWKGRENGLRKDIIEKFAELEPGVFRFPGGCIVEGTDLDTRYRWKNTVGPVENRPLNRNRWENTFTHRLYPDYHQSNGLGFYEYFLLSEDIGAEPLPVLNVGMACQYQNWNEPKAHCPVDSLDQYIQDAVDLVEFANGPVTSKWGKLRADMGHPEPFNLRYLAIGNEQWGPMYVERLEKFLKVLRKKCPDIKIIGSSGPNSEGEDFDYLWPEMRRLGVDLVDEHFYRDEDWFMNSMERYDKYPRRGPKVFAGEYACHPKGKKYNHFAGALMEGAFMTGMERNADVVEMATYAPLLAHEEGWQWRPDMIWFDNLDVAPTTSYYVQKLFAMNLGERVIPTGLTGGEGVYAVASQAGDDVIVKVVNIRPETVTLNLDLKGGKGWKNAGHRALVTTMSSADLDAENTVAVPDAVVPVTGEIMFEGSVLPFELKGNSINVVRISK